MPAKFLREPPVIAMSSTVKSVEASDRVKLMTAVSPTINDVTSLVITRVGACLSTVFIVILTEELSVLGLPAVSVKAPASTESTPSAELLRVGMKFAV